MTKAERLEQAKNKFYELVAFDAEYAINGTGCGIDEAGRGPLAGPVAAAAVVLPQNCKLIWLNDSKKVSPKQRAVLYEQIMATAIVGVGMVSSAEIDETNVLRAALKAMELAFIQLNEKTAVNVALVDGTISPNITVKTIPVPQGDSKSASIAAASIVAKVTRDNFMEQAAIIYPEYGFETHKGYGTAAHYTAIKDHGLCPLHRRTFLRNVTLKS